LVTYNGFLYASKFSSNTGNTPTGGASDNTYWMYIPGTAAAAGTDTQVQFNDNGLLGGDADFTFNKTTNQIAIATGSAAAPTLIPTGDTNTGMWFPAADTIALSTNGSERLRINSAGLIGIGTTSPASQLNIASSVAFNPSLILENSTDNAFGPFWYSRKTRGTAPANSGDALGAFLFTSPDSGGTVQNACYIEALSAGAGATWHSAYFRFISFDTSGTFGVRLIVDSQGLLLQQGTALLPSLTRNGDNNTGLWFPAADTIAASTGGSERMRIDSSGNVGIGTSSPSQKLDVSGSIITSQSITIGTGGSFTAGSIASNVNWGMYFQAKQASPALGHFVWSTSAAVELFRINSSGVLILGSGEASATVAGNTLRAPSSSGTNIAGGNLTIAGGAGTGTGGGGHIAFQTAAAGSTGSTANTLTERLRITSAGNIGINTTAPDALLSVNGIASFGAGTVTTPSLAAFGDLNTGMWFPAADTIAWSTGGSECVRIDSSGRVGVGTSSPNARLEVVSTIADVFARSNSSSSTSFLGVLRNDYFSGPSFAGTYLLQSGADRTGTTFGISNANLCILSFQNVANGVIGTNGNAPLIFATLSLERFRVDASGNILIGATAAGTSAAKVLGLGNATAPSTGPADTLQIYSSDLSAGNTMLSLWTEGTVVNANTTAATTHRIAIRVNGTVYYLLANTAA
jgi:hypothetical protein